MGFFFGDVISRQRGRNGGEIKWRREEESVAALRDVALGSGLCASDTAEDRGGVGGAATASTEMLCCITPPLPPPATLRPPPETHH